MAIIKVAHIIRALVLRRRVVPILASGLGAGCLPLGLLRLLVCLLR